MRATTLLLSAALTLSATTAFAQSSYNRVVEPVQNQATANTIFNAPIEYHDNGVMKAQYFNADDLSDEEYQKVLAEADRIRTYRDQNGLNFESEYISSGAPTYVAPTYIAPSYSSPTTAAAPGYQEVELFAPQTPSYTTSSSSKLHTVSKGDTLYNLSKRYATTVPAIQAENNLSGTTLSLGQQIRIPGVTVESFNTVSEPLYANHTPVYANSQPTYSSSTPVYEGSTSYQNYISSVVVEPTPDLPTSQVQTTFSGEKVYAVLPQDNLYKISRFTCVDVKDIIARNGITNPDNLSPGDKLTLPAGNCLGN